MVDRRGLDGPRESVMPSFLKYSQYYQAGATTFSSIDGSTTIPVGGGAVLLFDGITPVNGYEICNVEEAQDLWISDTTIATANGVGSFRIAAGGGTYCTPPRYHPLGPVSAFSTKVTGHKVTARAW